MPITKILTILTLSLTLTLPPICCQQQPKSHNHTIYHIIPDYDTYHRTFAEQAGPENTVEMTEHGTGLELCAGGLVCRFWVYLNQPKDQEMVKYTVLMTSGMHGNQLLGPTTLLYLYPMLKSHNIRIIYFPVMNPSGYDRKYRKTFPNQIDLNRDYPIDKNTDCYKGTATHIMDKLFRKYKIDLTINLHNGGDEISWNWGTKYNEKFPRTEEYGVYEDIGQMMKFYGGYNKRLGISEFKTGTMDEVVYPADGTLDDWAYAGSWAQSSVYKCDKYSFEPYPREMHQGLVFLLELGIHNAPENKLGTSEGLNEASDSNKSSNGYITRALRMLRQLIKVVSPTISAFWYKGALTLKIQGCKKVQKFNIEIKSFIQSSDDKKINIDLNKIVNLKNSFSHLIEIGLKVKPKQGQKLVLQYQLQCDKEWQGQGKTFLSKKRLLNGEIFIEPSFKNTEQFTTINGKQLHSQKIYWILLIVPIILFGILTHRLFFKRTKQKRQSKIKNPVQESKLGGDDGYTEVEMEIQPNETDQS